MLPLQGEGHSPDPEPASAAHMRMERRRLGVHLQLSSCSHATSSCQELRIPHDSADFQRLLCSAQSSAAPDPERLDSRQAEGMVLGNSPPVAVSATALLSGGLGEETLPKVCEESLWTL